MKKVRKMAVSLLTVLTLVSVLGISASAEPHWAWKEQTGSGSGAGVKGKVGIYGDFVGSSPFGKSIITTWGYLNYSNPGYVFSAVPAKVETPVGNQINWVMYGKTSSGTILFTRSLSQHF